MAPTKLSHREESSSACLVRPDSPSANESCGCSSSTEDDPLLRKIPNLERILTASTARSKVMTTMKKM
ncbi:hypothetical protein L484_010157 [Morus notabilis]|uniref:Uncharacterized protein n=1 Tax=Morus notabilis TaxID=981085 RepID=W9R9C9_9ROSA|nr:hypothetical protein L484_010157 [Morus notabilis]